MVNLEELYCGVDDFCQKFMPLWHQQLIENGLLKRYRQASLSLSEVMTILILFHMSHHRDFKTFYLQYVRKYLHQDVPELVSCAFLSTRKAKTAGIAFIDSTKIAVCHNLRIPRHRVFEGMAQRVQDGFMALSFVWLSMIVANCWPLS
nr:transposase [Photorhabdus bodei]